MIDLALVNRILRAPASVADECKADHDVARIAKTALVTLFVAAAAFGAAAGSWLGGAQIAFAALKMPIGILATLALAAPAFYALAAVFGRPWPLRAVLSLVLAAGARFALVLLATTPPLWLAIDLGAPYHAARLLAAIAYGTAGLAGLQMLVRGLGDGAGKHATIGLFVGVFLLVGAQNAWVLRPWLGERGNEMTLLTHKREGGLAVQLVRSAEELAGRR